MSYINCIYYSNVVVYSLEKKFSIKINETCIVNDINDVLKYFLENVHFSNITLFSKRKKYMDTSLSQVLFRHVGNGAKNNEVDSIIGCFVYTFL